MRQLQKRLAAKILKCGLDKVWIDPNDEKVRKAITRSDIRRFIKEGSIKKIKVKKIKVKKKKKKQRAGSRKGKFTARTGKKTAWLKIVRPQRRLLKKLKDENKIDIKYYRKVYLLIKGGKFRTKKHMLSYLKENNIMIKGEKK